LRDCLRDLEFHLCISAERIREGVGPYRQLPGELGTELVVELGAGDKVLNVIRMRFQSVDLAVLILKLQRSVEFLLGLALQRRGDRRL
jgi:hypothetical protein